MLDYDTILRDEGSGLQAKKLMKANASKACASFARLECRLLMQVLAPAVEIHIIQRKASNADQPIAGDETL